jgi:hypothetical protein
MKSASIIKICSELSDKAIHAFTITIAIAIVVHDGDQARCDV